MKAIVIGAGPAGLSAAWGLKKIGYRVTVFEQRPARPARVCGTFLSPEAVSHLRNMDMLDEVLAEGAVQVPETRITNSENGRETLVTTKQSQQTALALPRPDLETAMANKLNETGTAIHYGANAVDFKYQDEIWTIGTRTQEATIVYHTANILVLADGRFSRADDHTAKPKHGWFGWNATFGDISQAPGQQSLHLFPGGYVGIVTYKDGTSNVCGLTKRISDEPKTAEHLFHEAIEKSPAARTLLVSAKKINEWIGVGPLPYSIRMRTKSDVILAGDAAAVGDPFMGEGIGRALGAGPMLVAAARGKNLVEDYAHLWKKHYSKRLWLGHGARMMLSGRRMFKWGTFVVQRRPFLDFLTPFFHVGFAS